MDAILPVPLATPFWNSAVGLDLVARYFSQVAEVGAFARVMVATGHAGVAAMAAARGWDVQPAPGIAGPGCPLLPPGGLAALEAAGPRRSAVAVLDHRNPGLGPDTIRRVAAAHDPSRFPVTATVRRLRDHACQLHLYTRVLALGAVFLPAEDSTGKTRPIALDWPGLGLLDPRAGETFRRDPGQGEGWFAPAGPGEAPLLWQVESPARARLLAPSREAVLVCRPAEGPRVRLAQDGRSLDVEGSEAGFRGVLRLLPLTPAGAVPVAVLDYPLDGLPARIVPRDQVPDLSGYVFQVLQVVEDGPFEYIDAFVAPELPFTVQPDKDLTRVNRATGAPVCGRQDFVPLWEPDGCMAVLEPGAETALGQGVLEQFLAVRLPEEAALCIDDEFDYHIFAAGEEA